MGLTTNVPTITAGRADREKAGLLAALDAQRGHILSMVDGLDEQRIRTPALPSGWHCLGLVRHLTATEDYWFRRCANGEPTNPALNDGDDEWTVGADETAESVIDRYRTATAHANEIIAATSLDAPPAQPDPEWQDWGMDVADLRTIVIHMVIETATHAGHLDAARELIDGRQWIVM